MKLKTTVNNATITSIVIYGIERKFDTQEEAITIIQKYLESTYMQVVRFIHSKLLNLFYKDDLRMFINCLLADGESSFHIGHISVFFG